MSDENLIINKHPVMNQFKKFLPDIVAVALFALIAFLAGAQRVKKLFPPVVVGPIIVVIGMTLAPTVIKSNIVDQYTPDATGHAPMKDYEAWTIALVTALVIVIVAIFAKGMLKSLKSSFASSSVLAVVTKMMSIPLVLSTLSYPEILKVLPAW